MPVAIVTAVNTISSTKFLVTNTLSDTVSPLCIVLCLPEGVSPIAVNHSGEMLHKYVTRKNIIARRNEENVVDVLGILSARKRALLFNRADLGHGSC